MLPQIGKNRTRQRGLAAPARVGGFASALACAAPTTAGVRTGVPSAPASTTVAMTLAL
jgi:hypothetical protein